MSKQESSLTPRAEEGQSEVRRPVGYFELIRRNLNFRCLWAGQVASLLGDWFNLIASAILIAKLTGSGLAMGILFTIRMVAPFVIAPIAGICADRYNRKHLLIITDITRAFIVFGFLFVRNESHVWLFYTFTMLLSAVSGFFSPARSAILPDITSAQELGAANTLGAATWSVMLAFGAMIGGLTTGIFGIQTAFIVDGLTFLVSAAFLLPIKLPGPPSVAPGTPAQAKLSALRYMFRDPDILFIAMHKAALALLLSSGFQILQIEIANTHFVIGGGGAISLGLMYGVNGIGSGIGPILTRRWTGDQDRLLRISISIGYLVGTFGLVITAPIYDLTTVLIGGFVRSVGGGMIWVFSTQLLFQRAPNELRGRIFSTEFAFFTLMASVATAVVGSLLDRFPLHTILWGMAALPLIPTVLWSLWQTRYNQRNQDRSL